MKEFKFENHYTLRLDKDEDLFPTLEAWAIKNQIKTGYFKGIGALKELELGFYHLHKKVYTRKFFKDECELLSLDGNMTFKEGAPLFHIHAVLGDEEFKAFGGHLFFAKVAVTCEIQFVPLEKKIERAMNEDIGLYLMHSCPIS